MSLRALALSCFFLSGATGLLYQVLWARMLGGVIGNTHFSITAVVAVFMGGLALGSRLGGQAADRSRNPLRLYGILIFAVGILCLLVPLLISLAEPVFAWLYQDHEGNPEATPLLLFRLLFCVIVLLGPTTCMGATLPVLSKFLTTRMSKVGMSIGGLYTVNTFGAFFGAALTGFFAIATLGIWGTTALAVVIDIVIGVVVVYAARGLDAPVAESSATEKKEEPPTLEATPVPFNARLCVFCFGITGFANMLLQISWTKALIPTIGNSTYAFSLIVTLFILGIAFGGLIMSLVVDRIKKPVLVLGLIIAVKGLLVSATIPALGRFPLWGARLFDQVEEPSYSGFLWIKLLMVAGLVLPCTLLMGTVFPLVSKIRTLAIEKVGNAVGSAYFSNTLGSILGTLAAGFLFVPVFGEVFHTLYLSAVLNLLVGLALTWAAVRSLAKPAVRAAALACACTVTLLSLIPLVGMRPNAWDAGSSFWHPAIMSLGAYSYFQGSYYENNPNGSRRVKPIEELIVQTIENNEVLFHQVGLHAEVTVVEKKSDPKIRALRISGKADASIGPDGGFTQDLPHQVLAGHLPMLLHPEPKRVLTLGLGGGVTLGTLTLYPLPERSIDNLEISHEVIEAARVYFSSANRGSLNDHPKVRNVVGDGRNHLQFTTESYDVITSVPSNPWIAGIGNLFTTEFFEICRKRLSEDGIICQWIHKINMREKDLKTVFRTFTSVFDQNVQLWDLGFDCLLIGSKQPIRLDSSRLELLFKNPGFRSDLESLGVVDATGLLRHYRMDAAALARYTGAGPLNKDSFPVLEFECPKGLYGHSFTAYRHLAQAGSSPPDSSWIKGLSSAELATAGLRQEAFRQLELAESLRRQLEKTNLERGKNTRNLIGHLEKIQSSLAETNDEWLDQQATFTGFRATRTPGKTLQEYLMYYYLVIARELQKKGNAAEAAKQVEKAFAFSGETTDVLKNTTRQLATACLQGKDPSGGISIMEPAFTRFPEDAGVVEFHGILHGADGQDAKAESLFKRALELAENNALRGASIQHNLGFLYQQRGNLAAAREAYEKALLLNPDHPGTRELLKALGNPGGN